METPECGAETRNGLDWLPRAISGYNVNKDYLEYDQANTIISRGWYTNLL